MKKISLVLLMIIAFSITLQAKKNKDNQLSKKEKKRGWVLLFDGESLENFKGYNKQSVPAKWIIEDSSIKFDASKKEGGGDIITKNKYENFELTLEWKISEGGNSGIFILGQEVAGDPIYKTAPEMQVLDNERHPDAKKGKNGNRKAGSLYDLIPANPQNAKPAGEWNKIVIKVDNGKVTHFQNGKKVVEYEPWSDAWKVMVKDSKFKDWQGFVNLAKKGHIGLQDHGDDVWYKNIKIKEL